jgi:hypothetical protein
VNNLFFPIKDGRFHIVACALASLLASSHANGFWVVNFGTAGTLPKGKIGFAAGMGGQMVFLGSLHLPVHFLLFPMPASDTALQKGLMQV